MHVMFSVLFCLKLTRSCSADPLICSLQSNISLLPSQVSVLSSAYGWWSKIRNMAAPWTPFTCLRRRMTHKSPVQNTGRPTRGQMPVLAHLQATACSQAHYLLMKIVCRATLLKILLLLCIYPSSSERESTWVTGYPNFNSKKRVVGRQLVGIHIHDNI